MQKINVCISRQRDQIEECWTQKDVLVVCSEIMDKLYVHTENLDITLTRDLIKKSFRHSLELDLKDVIFFMSKKIVIKKFIKKEKVKKEGINKRFGGLPPEELEKIKAQYFARSMWYQIEPKVYLLLENELNFAIITNDFFISNYIKYFQALFVDIVSSTMQEEPQIVESFANFLLREHFDAMLLLIAKELARMASKREGDAEAFIRYYNGDTILTPDGKQFVKPSIIDEQNNNWNALTVMSMAMQFYQQQTKIKSAENALEPYKQAIDTHDAQHEELKQNIEKLANEKEEFEGSSKDFFKELEEDKKKLDTLKNENKKNPSTELNEKINELSTRVKRSYKKEEEIFTQRKDIDNKISSLNTRVTNHKTERKTMFKKYENSKKKIDTLKEEFMPIEKKYEIAMSALAKTISQKPRQV